MPATEVHLPKPRRLPRPAFIPPHALPERRPRPVAPDGAQLVSRLADGRTMRLRTTILATLALAFSLTACGRSDALEGDPAGIYEVRSARDVTLDDGEIVFVEVTEPASPEVTAEVMGLHDGCTMDDLLDAISPDGDEKLHFFGDVAVHVKVEGDLRAVIWF